MMKISKKWMILGLIATFLFAPIAAKSAHALATLRISDDGFVTTTTVIDNGLGDLDSDLGKILFNDSVGVFTTLVELGLSGSPLTPELHLTSTVVSSGAGTLEVLFSDTGFTSLAGGTSALVELGGISMGSLTAFAFYDSTNALFGTGTSVGTVGPIGPGAVSGSISGPVGIITPFSLTLGVTIATTGPSFSSADAAVTVPEPSILLLMGAGLVGLGLSGKFRSQNG